MGLDPEEAEDRLSMWLPIKRALKRVLSVPSPLINVAAHGRDGWVREKAASLPAGTRVLDAGAGQCQYRSLFLHCLYKTQDFAMYGGTLEGPSSEQWDYGAIDYVSDISAIPVENGSFDVVLCTEVLEHLADPVSAIREFARVLRPGGTLLLSAPLGSGLHQEPFHYFGGFTPHFYTKYLREADIEPIEIRPIGGLLRHTGQSAYRVGVLLGQDRKNARRRLLRFVLMYWLPKTLARLEDEGALFEQFTVGYLVEGRKNGTNDQFGQKELSERSNALHSRTA